MNRKIIIIITVLICLCVALITAQHFANKETENTTVPVTLTEAPQTTAPTERETKEHSTEESTTAHTDKPESTAQTEKPTEKTSKKPTAPASSTAPVSNHQNTEKPSATEKESTSQTTKKPQSETTAATTKETTTKEKKEKITVTISISCEKALGKVDGLPESGYFLSPCKYTAEQGDTVFDVLEAAAKENGISLKYQSKSYIQAINGLAEKECGGGSGWTYKVNGIKPNKSAAKYEIAEGDIIEWYYVTSPND